MAREELDTSDSHDSFDIPRWHEAGALWLDYCDEYWRHLRRELEVMRLGPLVGYRGGDEVPYHEIENRYGRRLPAAARAAAGLRRSLALAVEQLLPDSGVTASDGEDEVERAMAGSPGWEEAVEIALGDVTRMKELLAAAMPGRGLTAASEIPEVILFLREELESQVRSFEALTRPARLSADPLPKTGYTRLPADRINKGVIEALAPGAMKDLPAGYLDIFGGGVKFWRAYPFDIGRRTVGYDQLVGVIGLREEPNESLWRLLRTSSGLAVKIHLALWERAYAESAVGSVRRLKPVPRTSDFITTTLASLCDDVGITRRKGSQKRESREAVAGLLGLLTRLELLCLYKPPRNEPPEVLRGAVWRRGVVPGEAGPYHDLFAQQGGSWSPVDPQAFSYAPGRYFENTLWRTHNRYVALAHDGLLGMSCKNKYRWDVMIGAYLTVLARMNGYRRVTLRLRTLAEKTGLMAVYGRQDLTRMEKLMLTALDRLAGAGVIRRWVVNNEKDADAGEAGAASPSGAVSTSHPKTKKGSLDQIVFIEWPEQVDERGRRLRDRRRKKRRAWLDTKGALTE